MQALNRPGIWLRAGMAGAVCGLDLPQALAGIPDECERGFTRDLLLIAEMQFIAAFNKKQ